MNRARSSSRAAWLPLALLLLLAPIGCKPNATPDASGLVIVNPTNARPYFHEFGRIPYGKRVRHDFLIENRDSQPVTIQDLLPSCSCTVPHVWYEDAQGVRVEGSRVKTGPVITLPPGVRAHVEVEIDTALVERTNVDKLAQVRIRSDSRTTPYLTLEMHLISERAFRSVPAKVALPDTPQSSGKSARTDITTEIKGYAARIVKVLAVEGPFEAEIQEHQIPGESAWILTVTAPPGLPLGSHTGAVILATTSPEVAGEGTPFTIPIGATVVPDIALRPPTLALVVAPGDTRASAKTTLAALAPGGRVRILSAVVEGPFADRLECTFDPLDADDSGRATRWNIVVRAREALAGMSVQGTLVVATDESLAPVIRGTIAGQVP